MDPSTFAVYAVAVALAPALARWFFVRKLVVPEAMSGLLYRNGKFVRALRPGACWTLRPGVSLTLVDLRRRLAAVRGQEVLTADNVGLKVSLAVKFSVSDPEAAEHRVESFLESLHVLAQIALREEAAAVRAEELHEKRVAIGEGILRRIGPEAAAFGLTVHAVEVKDAMFPGDLKHAFAEVLKAKKAGEAALERARGESAALRNLANAARLLEKNPALYRLRMLESVDAAGKADGNTLVLGLPPALWNGDGAAR